MRISCRYTTERIPLGYRMMFVSLIKEALQLSSQEYFEALYYYGDKHNKKSKDFCFSVFLKGYELKEDKDIFEIGDGLSFNISSPDPEFIINLYNGLLKLDEFQYKDFTLKKDKIHLLKEKNIFEEEVVFRTLSPIHITDKHKNSLSPYDKAFDREFNYTLDMILSNYRGEGLVEPVEFKPIHMTKVVVKEEIARFQELTGERYLHIESYAGIFKLKGNVSDLRDIYTLGASMRRNQGFGMIEVVV